MSTGSKIVSLEQASQIVNSIKSEDRKVVFTNGCFDILHLGHIDYLEKARHLGDTLVIGLNTDASVQRLKGPTRPINNQEFRSRMLAALAFVDIVVLFDEPTPQHLIETLLPNILVKGDDYQIGNIVGAETVISHGGEVQTVPLVPGYSTTQLIEKIKNLK